MALSQYIIVTEPLILPVKKKILRSKNRRPYSIMAAMAVPSDSAGRREEEDGKPSHGPYGNCDGTSGFPGLEAMLTGSKVSQWPPPP